MYFTFFYSSYLNYLVDTDPFLGGAGGASDGLITELLPNLPPPLPLPPFCANPAPLLRLDLGGGRTGMPLLSELFRLFDNDDEDGFEGIDEGEHDELEDGDRGWDAEDEEWEEDVAEVRPEKK